jgi:outer membrane protein assembly factor BamB
LSLKKIALLFPVPLTFLALFLIMCRPPVPILLNDTEHLCTWNQGGGSSKRNAFYDTHLSGYPAPLWSHRLKTPLIVDPTAGTGFLFVPTTDNKVSVLSISDGTRLSEIGFKGPIPAPIGILDSLMIVNEDGRRMVIQNWVNNHKIWQVPLKGADFEPLIYNGRVYWQDGDDLYHCYEISEGKRVWERKLDFALISPGAASESSLVLAGSGPIMECLSTEDGRSIWKIDMEARVRKSPEIMGDAVLYCTVDGHVGELSLRDGTRIWDVDIGPSLIASPATDGEGIYLGTNEGRLMKLSFISGQVDWMHEIDAPIKGGCAIFGNLVIFVSLNHKAYFVDKNDGTTRSEFETRGMLSTRPIACSDRIFIAGEDKNVYCFQVAGNE